MASIEASVKARATCASQGVVDECAQQKGEAENGKYDGEKATHLAIGILITLGRCSMSSLYVISFHFLWVVFRGNHHSGFP